MTKIDVPQSSARRLLHPKLTVLLTSVNEEGKPNIITLAWTMPTSFDPPLIAVSIGTSRFSHDLVENSGEFVVNIPTRDILDATLFCGSSFGKSVNKFKETGLTPIKSEEVTPPRVGECVAHLECKVVDKIRTGDHTIFVGEIVASSADEELFDKKSGSYNLEKLQLLYHVGGPDFVSTSEEFKA